MLPITFHQFRWSRAGKSFIKGIVKLFYTGPMINVEMLVMMLDKHGIAASQESVDPGQGNEEDLNRLAKVFVQDEDYERAYQLFYAEREDEL